MDVMNRHEKTNLTSRGRSRPAVASHGKSGADYSEGITATFTNDRQPSQFLSTRVDSAVGGSVRAGAVVAGRIFRAIGSPEDFCISFTKVETA